MNKNGVPNYTFHKTGQFRNVIKHIKDRNAFEGKDGEGNAILNYNKVAPTIEYIGTTKLHGTNGSIILHSDGVISFHSKNNLLGFVREGEFTLNSDNSGFAQEMFDRIESVRLVMRRAEEFAGGFYPVKVSGEWCGQGVQKGVGISFLPKKSFFIFGIKVKDKWLPAEDVSDLTCHETIADGVHAITDFDIKSVTVDFNNPEKSQNLFAEYTEEVEECCPVSEKLDLRGPEGNPQRLGEGLVWTPRKEPWCEDSGTWFKTKGQKHSVSKIKTVAKVDPEVMESIEKFVEYTVTENRLEQGLQEVGLDTKNIGKFIGWINKDIHSEEQDTLESSNLTMKQVGKSIANKARVWYINKLNGM